MSDEKSMSVSIPSLVCYDIVRRMVYELGILCLVIIAVRAVFWLIDLT